jgi:hypothetical protein
VQIDYDVVHLRTSLVQLFVLFQLDFEEVVQIIELRRFGGTPNGYPFAALVSVYSIHLTMKWCRPPPPAMITTRNSEKKARQWSGPARFGLLHPKARDLITNQLH